MGFVRGIVAAVCLVVANGCGEPAADATGEVHEGWSGTPPAEPAAVGERCDEQWVWCEEGSYCDFGGSSDWPGCTSLGVCAAPPEACEAEAEPVCGCDGALYAGACAAAMAGVGTRGAEGCTPPVGFFACGFEFCAIATEYCEHVIGHGQPESWTCRALGCAVGMSGCACITEPSPCGEPEWYPVQSCEVSEDGGTVLVCLPA
ncbi:MAG: hypothetical protein JNL82_03070 [Myxococcales bacterium]|nr:hypothetical protein [Myxococcales bacterium]